MITGSFPRYPLRTPTIVSPDGRGRSLAKQGAPGNSLSTGQVQNGHDFRRFRLAIRADSVARQGKGLGSEHSDVITRAQVARSRLGTARADNRLRYGRWQRLQRGVYAPFTGEPSREARIWAALLRAGPGATLSQAAATFEEAYAWICDAIGRRRTTAARIRIALDARPKFRRRRDIELALGDAGDGALSLLELRYVQGVERSHGLPAARRQARISSHGASRYLDNLYEGYRICVEIDGTAAHPAAEQWRDKMT
jgi:hypothetical protein